MGSIFMEGWHIRAVAEIMTDARRRHRVIEVGDLWTALRRVQTDAYDQPSASHSQRLGEGLRGILTVGELLSLCHQVGEQLERSIHSTDASLKAALDKAAELPGPDEKYRIRIADLAIEPSGFADTGLIEFAVILKALEWAIRPPEHSMPMAIS